MLIQSQPRTSPAWSYIRDSAQERALSCPANHLLLTGGRGWGKTEIQLMRFRRLVGKGYGVFWRGIIFDREYKNLDDLITKSKRLFRAVANDGAEFLSSNSALKWRWPTGEELLFRVAKSPDDYWAYHGHEYAFIGWNELTKYPSDKLYRKMMSVNRTGFLPEVHTPKINKQIGHNGGPRLDDVEGVYATPDGKPLPPIPLEVCSTTNPYGPGHNWVKREFIDVASYGVITGKSHTVYNPKTKQDEIVTKTQATVFGSYRENPFLSPEYIAGLYDDNEPNVVKAWIHGSWDIVAGGALDDVWRKHRHVIPRFKVPSNWYVDRALDWGSTHPFSVGWFAESNGEDVKMPDGTMRNWPRGTIIQIGEWYGTKLIGSNVGLRLGAKSIALGIKERERALIDGKWISGPVSLGPADNQIKNVNERDTDTIAKKMADNGVRWEDSDKGKGSRKNGLQLIRDRLEAITRGEGPGLLFTDNCVASISTIPMLPRDELDPDDVDSDTEDHPYDMVRYRVLKGNNRLAKVIPVRFPR